MSFILSMWLCIILIVICFVIVDGIRSQIKTIVVGRVVEYSEGKIFIKCKETGKLFSCNKKLWDSDTKRWINSSVEIWKQRGEIHITRS